MLQTVVPLHIALAQPIPLPVKHIRSRKCRRRASTSSLRAPASVGDAHGMHQAPICPMAVSAASAPSPSPLGLLQVCAAAPPACSRRLVCAAAAPLARP